MGEVAPRHFKYELGQQKEEFSGYQQHDSHELISFLLDTLHEDLNEIQQKPYFEDEPEQEGRYCLLASTAYSVKWCESTDTI